MLRLYLNYISSAPHYYPQHLYTGVYCNILGVADGIRCILTSILSDLAVLPLWQVCMYAALKMKINKAAA